MNALIDGRFLPRSIQRKKKLLLTNQRAPAFVHHTFPKRAADSSADRSHAVTVHDAPGGNACLFRTWLLTSSSSPCQNVNEHPHHKIYPPSEKNVPAQKKRYTYLIRPTHKIRARPKIGPPAKHSGLAEQQATNMPKEKQIYSLP